MHRAPKWRSQLRTRQRARVTLNATWLEVPTPRGPTLPTTRDEAREVPTTGGPSNDDPGEPPETAAASRKFSEKP